MNKKRLSIGLACLLVSLTLAGIALAQISASYDLHWHLIDSGGDARQSANYGLQDSLGSAFVDVSTRANYQIESGFLNFPAEQRFELYLPLVLR